MVLIFFRQRTNQNDYSMTFIFRTYVLLKKWDVLRFGRLYNTSIEKSKEWACCPSMKPLHRTVTFGR
jgi:hypothetical protein